MIVMRNWALEVLAVIAFIFALSLSAAAQEGVRHGIVHRTDISGIQAAALSQAVGLDAELLSVAISYPDNTSVEVTVGYLYTAVTPVISDMIGTGGQLTLSSTARMGN